METPSPQPTYEIDTGETPPATEAEAVARLQREDEALARRIGVAPSRGGRVGKKWMDEIGGKSADQLATRFLEQEAIRSNQQKRARRQVINSILGALVFIVVLGGIGAVIADYTGAVHLGIFPRKVEPPAVVEVPKPIQVTLPKPVAPVVVAIKAPVKPVPVEAPVAPVVLAPEPEPVVTAPAAPLVETADHRRARDRVAAKQRALTVVTQDLAQKDALIRSHLFTLYGFTVEPRDVVPDRIAWRRPSAALEQEDAYAAAKPTNNTQAVHGWMNRRSNADTTVRNLLNAIAEERGNEASIKRQVERVKKDLQQAQTALESISH